MDYSQDPLNPGLTIQVGCTVWVGLLGCLTCCCGAQGMCRLPGGGRCSRLGMWLLLCPFLCPLHVPECARCISNDA